MSPDPRVPEGDGPILYYSAASHPCQYVRLVLAEKGVTYRLRSVNLSSLEQLEPWFLQLNSKGTVPVLVNGDKVVSDSFEIARYVDATFPGPALLPGSSKGAAEKILKLISEVSVEDLVALSVLKGGNGLAKAVLPQLAEGTLVKLKALADSHEAAEVTKKAVPAKIEAATAKLGKYAEPAVHFDKAAAAFTVLLEAAEKALAAQPTPAEGEEAKPAFLCGGEAPTLADLAFASLLARANWSAEARALFSARPPVAAFWAHMHARPAFESADVWTGLKPVAGLMMVGEAALDAYLFLWSSAEREWSATVAPGASKAWHTVADPVGDAARATGSAINTHIISPITDSPQWKGMTLVVNTTVVPKFKAAAHSTGDFLDHHVVSPCKTAASATADAAKRAAEATAEAAQRAASATAEAAKHAAEATADAAHRAAEATKHAAEQAAEATKNVAERAKSGLSPKGGEGEAAPAAPAAAETAAE